MLSFLMGTGNAFLNDVPWKSKFGEVFYEVFAIIRIILNLPFLDRLVT